MSVGEYSGMDDASYDLFSQPDIAQEIGFLIIYTASLEAWLFEPLAVMLRIKTDDAAAILMPIDNIRAKVDILFNTAKIKKGRPLPDAILACEDALNAALAFRNTVAHSSFGFPLPGGKMVMASHAITGGRRGKPKFTPLDCAEIRSHTTAIKSFIATISLHCGQGFIGLRRDPPKGTSSRDRIVIASRRSK